MEFLGQDYTQHNTSLLTSDCFLLLGRVSVTVRVSVVDIQIGGRVNH